MYDTPISLQDACIECITDNIEALCETQTNLSTNQTQLVFRANGYFFHHNISDYILKKLADKSKLNDKTLSLFDPDTTVLKHASIRESGKDVTLKGLRVLRRHKICDLEAVGLNNISVNEVIGCFGEWTLANLRSLNVAKTTFTNSAKFCVFVSLSRLKNLQCLNVSSTGFNKHGLDIVVEDLPLLENLDISCTPVTDITSLRKCRSRLKFLAMYNVRVASSDDCIGTLSDMPQLQHLDISYDLTETLISMKYPSEKIYPENLLRKTYSLRSIRSLDISGHSDITEKALGMFIETHRDIKFLGLLLTELYSVDSINEDIVVSGDATESQIMESLRRNIDRPVFIHKTLHNLFTLTKDEIETKLEDIIQLILVSMSKYPKNLHLQMAATACLYNLSKGDLGLRIHPGCLKDVVKMTLNAMQVFPIEKQLQKNCLLTLCSDRILQQIDFDHYLCARLVLDNLCVFVDASMTRMCVAICSIVVAKIPTKLTSKLGASVRYMQKLLQLVKTRVDSLDVDIIMKFTLSALWNLTDESPGTCHVFIDQGGLKLFIETLKAYENGAVSSETKIQVETKCLGLLNNIAEVDYLRLDLMKEDFLTILMQLVASEHIEISYFASGVMVHILTEGSEGWKIDSISRQQVINQVTSAVVSWKEPKGEMVAYRSFQPFLPLLEYKETPVVPLWAVWAISHVCSAKHGSRYCKMLKEEGGYSALQNLLASCNEKENEVIIRISRSVIQLCDGDTSTSSQLTH